MIGLHPDRTHGGPPPERRVRNAGGRAIVVLALLAPALLVGALVALALTRRPVLGPASARPATNAALIIAGGVVVGVLALLVRTHSALIDVDGSIAGWGTQHADGFEERVLDVVTHLGSATVLVPLMVVVTIVEYIRRPSRWLFVFALAVGVGQALVNNGVKDLVERARPTVTAAAASLGPSFPSGHTAGAAACFAAIALMTGRGRSQRTQAVLAGIAVAVAVAVAASRVLLGVHWFTDVIGGLALGWAWFAIFSIAFGGRLLRFGLRVEAAQRTSPDADPEREPASANQ